MKSFVLSESDRDALRDLLRWYEQNRNLLIIPPRRRTVVPFNPGFLAPKPIAWYPFNDNALDCSGNGRDGTISGTVVSKHLAEFDGVDDYIDCGVDFIGTGPLTICAGIRPVNAGEGAAGRIIDNGKTIFRLHHDALRQLIFSSDGGATNRVSTVFALTWHKHQHVAVTRTAEGIINFYIDGVSSGAVGFSAGTPLAGSTNVFIGNNLAGSATFNGGMDDLRIYNRVLPLYQIHQIIDERNRLFVHANEIFGSLTVFEVQSEATGDGVYNCREQKLDATEWDDTAGDNKFDDFNTTSIEVLNLAEFNPEATYVAHLAAGDMIAAWRRWDDEGNARWEGIPIRQANADRARIAFCNGAPAGKTISAFLDRDTTGTAITVYTLVAQTGECPNNTFNMNVVDPRLSDGDPIMVHKTRFYDGADNQDYWICDTTFQPTEDCVCS